MQSMNRYYIHGSNYGNHYAPYKFVHNHRHHLHQFDILVNIRLFVSDNYGL